MTHDEILTGLYDRTLVGDKPAVVELTGQGLEEGLGPEQMLFDAIARVKKGLVTTVFDTTDRVQHMFYRYLDPTHPANRGKETTRHADAIGRVYERMDAILGKVLAAADDPKTAAAVASLGVSGYPSPTIATVSHSFTVTARDAYGNVATSFLDKVHFTSTDTRPIRCRTGSAGVGLPSRRTCPSLA